jgi:hypothetical protein
MPASVCLASLEESDDALILLINLRAVLRLTRELLPILTRPGDGH